MVLFAFVQVMQLFIVPFVCLVSGVGILRVVLPGGGHRGDLLVFSPGVSDVGDPGGVVQQGMPEGEQINFTCAKHVDEAVEPKTRPGSASCPGRPGFGCGRLNARA